MANVALKISPVAGTYIRPRAIMNVCNRQRRSPHPGDRLSVTLEFSHIVIFDFLSGALFCQ
jgi:hypothetical protein